MLLLTAIFAVLSTAAELAHALNAQTQDGDFSLEATVISECKGPNCDFAVQDASGSVILSPGPDLTNAVLAVGMRIRTSGKIDATLFSHTYAACDTITLLGHATPPEIEAATFKQILSGRCDARRIRADGTLRDYFTDEIDPSWVFLILNQGTDTLYATCRRSPMYDLNRLDSLIGSRITLTGLCNPRPSGCRRKLGRILELSDIKDIAATQMTADPFLTTRLLNNRNLQPAELSMLGRQRIRGNVIAVWQNKSLLIKTPTGRISRIDLAKDDPPAFNQMVDVVGFPETDLYRVNFTRAIWRASGPNTANDEPATYILSATLMSNIKGDTAIRADFHGRAVRLRGTVRSLPSVGNDGRFYLESDGYTFPVDISANPSLAEKLEIGSVIDVTGVCVMDIENWRPNLVFPHIKEVMIVTRTPTDIVVIRRPPWWTPSRLMIVIGSLLTALLGILVWNRSLQTLAHKRGKALANEELERLEADLKVCERTRLAVELHDTLAQNLTGVSMEIGTALRGEEPLPPNAAQHMGRALRTIDSCRGELRNCLWDLRNQALEEEDMNKAIRLTLSQTIGKSDLFVRFNVPRSRFTDNTAHTILRIIRELAANAVRHGHATEIKIAGSIENDVLKFSVRDNGCGFDPDACSGVLDGHFGLQGVRERVASFEGDIQIESAAGKGTKVVVSINAPQTEDETKI